MEILLQYGASTSATDRNHNSPLHVAVFKRNEECVRILLRHKCPVNEENLINLTPLMMACHFYNRNIVERLLRVRTINVTHMNSLSKTALVIAAEKVCICNL